VALGPARDGDATLAVDPEDGESLIGLWATQQLLEPAGIFEPLFERFLTILGVRWDRCAMQPAALLFGIEELAQAFEWGGPHQEAA
jgi:hypothetical protein